MNGGKRDFLAELLRRSGLPKRKPISPYRPPQTQEERMAAERTPEGALEWALDIISRPMYAIGGAIKAGQSGENVLGGALKGITGASKYYPSERIGTEGITGFATDVALDPLTYLTGGAGKAVRGGVKGVSYTLNKTGILLLRKETTRIATATARAMETAQAAGKVIKLNKGEILNFANKAATSKIFRAIDKGEPWTSAILHKPGLRLGIPLTKIESPRIAGGLDAKVMKTATYPIRMAGKGLVSVPAIAAIRKAFIKPIHFGKGGISTKEIEAGSTATGTYRANIAVTAAKQMKADLKKIGKAYNLTESEMERLVNKATEGISADTKGEVRIPNVAATEKLKITLATEKGKLARITQAELKREAATATKEIMRKQKMLDLQKTAKGKLPRKPAEQPGLWTATKPEDPELFKQTDETTTPIKPATAQRDATMTAQQRIVDLVSGKIESAKVVAQKAKIADIEKKMAQTEPLVEVVTRRDRIIPDLKMPEEMHPIVKKIKEKYDQIFKWDQQLQNRPQYTHDYMAHIRTTDARKLIDPMTAENIYEKVGENFGTRLGSSAHRTALGTGEEINTWIRKEILAGRIKTTKPMTEAEVLKFKFFETDPVETLLKRELSTIRATTTDNFVKETLSVFSQARIKSGELGTQEMVEAALKENPGYSALLLKGSKTIHIMPTSLARELDAAKISEGQLGRMPERAAIIKSIPTNRQGTKEALRAIVTQDNAIYNYGGHDYVLPKEVVAGLLTRDALKEADYNAMLGVFDKVTNWWKTWATVMRPAFHFRNAMSNIFNNFLAGVKNPLTYTKATAIQMGIPIQLNVQGITLDGPEIAQLAREYGVTGRGLITDEIRLNVQKAISGTTPTDWLKVWNAQKFVPAQVGFKVGSTIEDNARLTLFIDGLEKGMGAKESAARVMTYLFDYYDLTHFEKNTMRRIMPFYTWSRKNIPLQLENLVKQPAKYAAIEKGKRAIEGDEKGIPRHELPEFIKKQFAIRTKRDAQTGEETYFLLGGWLPAADIERMDMASIFNMLHPLVKTPIEQTVNYSVWSTKQIERFPGEKGTFLGTDMGIRDIHILRNIVMLNEVDRIFYRNKSAKWNDIVGETFVKLYHIEPLRAKKSYYFQLGELLQKFKRSQATGKDFLSKETLEELGRRIQETRELQKRVHAEAKKLDPDFLKKRKADK